MAIYGFSNQDISTLVPLARSWNHPPEVAETTGCSSQGYDKAQRHYEFRSVDLPLSFKLIGTEQSPVVNPCFVIKNWRQGAARATLRLDDQLVSAGAGLRQGIVRDMNRQPTLVIWIRHQSTSPVSVQISSD